MYWTEIEIENNTSSPITTTIRKGTVLEPDGNNLQVQCLVVASDVTIHLPPRRKQKVRVPTLCMNRDLAPPHAVSGKLTPFLLTPNFTSQADVWTLISSPRTKP